MATFSSDAITGRKNPLITRLSKLSDKKYRDEENLFRIDGVKLFSEAVDSGVKTEYIFIAESKREKLTCLLPEKLASASGTVIFVSDEVFSKLTDESAPQGIVAFAEKFDTLPLDLPRDGAFRALYLSSVRDPGNLGTMVRTALALGIDRVFVSADCADIYSPKTVRASMGTIFRQNLSVVDDELDFAKAMRDAGCEIFAAALDRNAKKLGAFTLPERVCFAIGNEGHGLCADFIAACSGTVFIPMMDGCESLNAAMAATVLMWEMQRNTLICD